jgi:hypothetical protein
MNRKHNIYGTDGDTRCAIMYRTPGSRATNLNKSQYMSSVPDQTSL